MYKVTLRPHGPACANATPICGDGWLYFTRSMQPIRSVLLLFLCMSYPDAFAQHGSQTQVSKAQVIRVRAGSTNGWCSGGYCERETTIERGMVVTVSRSPSDKKKYPDVTVKRKITRQAWHQLQELVNAQTLAAFTGATECPTCADQPAEWIELQFSDGEKKSVVFAAARPPTDLAQLLQAIRNIGFASGR